MDRHSQLNEPSSESAGARIDRLPRIVHLQYTLFSILLLGYFFEFFDIFLLSYVAPNVSREFVLSDVELGILLSSIGYGMLVGAFVTGWISDRWGRKRAFEYTLAILSLFTFLTGFSRSVWQVILLMAIAGFGLGGLTGAASTFISELFPTRMRGKMMNVGTAFGASPSTIGVGLMAYFVVPIMGWRFPFLFGGAMGLILLIIQHFLLPESPRWLQSKGKWAEADRILSKMEKQASIVNVPSVRTPPQRQKDSFSISDLLGKNYARRTFGLWFIWLVAYLSAYGLELWIPTLFVRKLGSDIGLLAALGTACFTPIGCLLSASVTERVGRRSLMLWSYLSLALVCALFGYADAFALIFLFGALFYFLVGVRYSSEYAYTTEIYPTRARSTAFGVASGMGRVGVILGPVITGSIYATFGYTQVFIFNALLYVSLCAVGFFFTIKTRGLSLEEIAK